MPGQLTLPWPDLPADRERYTDPFLALEIERYAAVVEGHQIKSLGFVIVGLPREVASRLKAMDRTGFGTERKMSLTSGKPLA